jgi:hypothetical protein
MRIRSLFIAVAILSVALGCGRKLPPLPPTLPDPVEVSSITFVGQEVIAKAQCNMQDATVLLLGKPKGLCPNCTDDLVVKHKVTLEKPGELVLKDPSPESDYMVYRIAAEHGTTKWTTPARIVVKKQ